MAEATDDELAEPDEGPDDAGAGGARVRLRVSFASMTVDLDASEHFVEYRLASVLGDLREVAADLPHIGKGGQLGGVPDGGGHGGEPAENLSVTTATVAARLGSRTGSDLALAAAAKLALTDGRERFTRRDIMAEMRTAGSYFRKTYVSNFSNYLGTLLKDRKLVESSTGVYSLEAATLDEIRRDLE